MSSATACSAPSGLTATACSAPSGLTATACSAPSGLTKKRYTPPRPAPLPEDYEEFYSELTEAEKELDTLAKEMLGSSYVIQWTHMYLKWTKAKKTQKEQKEQKVQEEKKE
jgi:hypothetical protein